MRYDYFNDTANYSKIIEYNGPDGDGWASAGAGSIERGPNGTWYVIVRQRHSDGNRGRVYELYSAPNWSANWTLVFAEDMRDDSYSVEGASLRHYNGTWYLYFSFERSDGWRVGVVSARNVSDLKPQLADPDSWTVLTNDNMKDPRAFEVNGTYFLVGAGIIASESPTFGKYEKFDRPAQPFFDAEDYRGYNHGTVLHRNGTYVFWFSWETDDHISYWGFVSANTVRNLSDGTYLGSIRAGMSDSMSGDHRYMSYYSVDGRQVFIMEWDPDDDGVRETFLWDYLDA